MSGYVVVRDSLICGGRTYRVGEPIDVRALRPTTITQLVTGRKIALLNDAGEPIAETPRPPNVALPMPGKGEIRAQYKARA